MLGATASYSAQKTLNALLDWPGHFLSLFIRVARRAAILAPASIILLAKTRSGYFLNPGKYFLNLLFASFRRALDVIVGRNEIGGYPNDGHRL